MINKIKDSIWIGFLVGFGVPALLYGIFYLTIVRPSDIVTSGLYENATLLIIAVNGVLIRFFMIKREKDNIGKGIIGSTLLLAMAWIIAFHL
jgi:hypothetical protein